MSSLMLKKLVDSIIKPYLNAKKTLSENTKILICVETIQKYAFEIMPKTEFWIVSTLIWHYVFFIPLCLSNFLETDSAEPKLAY